MTEPFSPEQTIKHLEEQVATLDHDLLILRHYCHELEDNLAAANNTIAEQHQRILSLVQPVVPTEDRIDPITRDERRTEEDDAARLPRARAA